MTVIPMIMEFTTRSTTENLFCESNAINYKLLQFKYTQKLIAAADFFLPFYLYLDK